MSPNLSHRSQIVNRWLVCLSAAAVVALAWLALPLLAGPPRAKPVAELASLAEAKPDAGSSQRVRQMAAELKALQEEAAKDPARPTTAQVERELNRMLAARSGDPQVARLERQVKGLLALSLVLAVALGAVAVANLRRAPSALA
ncbi:MAG TPA: hypothetical protein VH988_05630 [Thermoanaerobaculia bacterium]|nr:hypothetical protein [Thermoanaerobaculia bacterium]